MSGVTRDTELWVLNTYTIVYTVSYFSCNVYFNSKDKLTGILY